MLGPDELLKLATAYAGATGIRLRTVGRFACNNDKIFIRLADGGGASSRSILSATEYFETNWPEGVRWPKGVPGGPRAAAKSPPPPAKARSRRMATA